MKICGSPPVSVTKTDETVLDTRRVTPSTALRAGAKSSICHHLQAYPLKNHNLYFYPEICTKTMRFMYYQGMRFLRLRSEQAKPSEAYPLVFKGAKTGGISLSNLNLGFSPAIRDETDEMVLNTRRVTEIGRRRILCDTVKSIDRT